MNNSFFKKFIQICIPLAEAISLSSCFNAATLLEESAAEADKHVAVPNKSLPEFMMQMENLKMGEGTAEPTPEQKKEELRVEQEQVETATVWLSDANLEQRVVGAQQLAAYPTPESERQLVRSLTHDPASEVRGEAAHSLGAFEKLKANTVQALLKALADPDENVRQAALDTLQNLHDQLENDGKKKDAKKILTRLKKQSQSSHVPQKTRNEIRDYLRDLLQ